jgi:hypothetical protein
MAGSWFTESEAEGALTIDYEGGNWRLAEPGVEESVVCLLEDNVGLSSDDAPHRIEVMIEKYVMGASDEPDYLFVSVDSEQTVVSEDEDNSPENSRHALAGSSGHYPRKQLSELSGSGEHVTVVGAVDSVFWVKKDERSVPDLKGRLVDESNGTEAVFVVSDGVAHPYLEQGKYFELQGVKDHHYEERNEVQVMITGQTNFVERGFSRETESTNRSASAGQSSPGGAVDSSSSSSALDDIAEELIGDEEFAMSENDESIVSKAKERARRQNRDPAIDPDLQPDKER